MKKVLTRLIKWTFFCHPLQDWLEGKRQEAELREWEKRGCPAPPPHIAKQRIIKKYAERYNLRIFVETGTYFGDMVEAMKDSFDRIYSIELSRELYEKAKDRFRSEKHIVLIQGDSGKELGNLMKEINQPTLFWLDGHYSGDDTARGEKDTPIYEELRHILDTHGLKHVMLIDDARCFGTDPAYPTMDEIKGLIHSKRENADIIVDGDSIRVELNK